MEDMQVAAQIVAEPESSASILCKRSDRETLHNSLYRSALSGGWDRFYQDKLGPV